jgi:hypothetical protein
MAGIRTGSGIQGSRSSAWIRSVRSPTAKQARCFLVEHSYDLFEDLDEPFGILFGGNPVEITCSPACPKGGLPLSAPEGNGSETAHDGNLEREAWKYKTRARYTVLMAFDWRDDQQLLARVAVIRYPASAVDGRGVSLTCASVLTYQGLTPGQRQQRATLADLPEAQVRDDPVSNGHRQTQETGQVRGPRDSRPRRDRSGL